VDHVTCVRITAHTRAQRSHHWCRWSRWSPRVLQRGVSDGAGRGAVVRRGGRVHAVHVWMRQYVVFVLCCWGVCGVRVVYVVVSPVVLQTHVTTTDLLGPAGLSQDGCSGMS
jgi:hypothetical protein